jgi:hypothetical protein
MDDQNCYVNMVKFYKGGLKGEGRYIKIILDNKTECKIEYKNIVDVTVSYNGERIDVRIVSTLGTQSTLYTFGVEHLNPVGDRNVGEHIKMKWENFQQEEAERKAKVGVGSDEEVNENL